MESILYVPGSFIFFNSSDHLLCRCIPRSTSIFQSNILYYLLRQECPVVRYRAAKGLDATSNREWVPSKLASAVWSIITTYKSLIPEFPQTETCELLIIDRSVDQVSYKLSDNHPNASVPHFIFDALC